MAPEEGLEPSTHRLTADCSTIELLWNTEMSRDGRRFSEGASIVSSRFVSSRFLSSRLFPEDEDVLAGQFSTGRDPFKIVQSHFPANLGLGHLVESFDRHPLVFTTVLHQDETPAWFECGRHAAGHLVGELAFVIHVDEDDQVEGVRWKVWIFGRRQDWHDLGQFPG